MKKKLIPLFFILFCCSLLFLLLVYSKECIELASNGLLIWFNKMIPTLFPFMVLSGFLVRTGLSYKIGGFLRPILGIILPLPTHMLYVVFMGFLCGFPMGAKIVTDMIEKKQITPREGQYLLSFCNNIGPLYLMGYVIPLFQYSNSWFILMLMYSIPILFGIFSYSRYFSHDKHPFPNQSAVDKDSELFCTEVTLKSMVPYKVSSVNYAICFQESLTSAIEQITLLGGCMVFFNTLLIIPFKLIPFISSFFPHSQIGYLQGIFCSFIEIGGGLQQLASSSIIDKSTTWSSPYLIISLLTFGGLSCIIQTLFIIKNTGLNIFTYLKQKMIQSCIYILLLFLFN